MSDELVKRLLNPPFGTETSELLLMKSAAARIEALTAERDALRERDIRGLQQAAAMARAMSDLLASPKGVVPESAASFYDAKQGQFFGLEIRKATP